MGEPKRIYVASRASVPERPAMWRRYREQWRPEREIVSSWIDESGPGETASFADLWQRIVAEVLSSNLVIVYAEPDDFPLKGAYVEVGAALGAGIPVAVVLPGVELDGSMRPIGSWVRHPGVTLHDSVEGAAASAPSRHERSGGMGDSRDHLRGHPITWDEQAEGYVYVDTGEPTASTWRDRPCGHCGRHDTPEGHDGCIGTLPGVVNACCGHGRDAEAYVVFADGSDVRGERAVAFMATGQERTEGGGNG